MILFIAFLKPEQGGQAPWFCWHKPGGRNHRFSLKTERCHVNYSEKRHENNKKRRTF